MKPIFIRLVIILGLSQKRPIQYHLILNILQYQNGVKNGFGKNIKKNQNMLLMELILIISNLIKEI